MTNAVNGRKRLTHLCYIMLVRPIVHCKGLLVKNSKSHQLPIIVIMIEKSIDYDEMQGTKIFKYCTCPAG